MKEYPTDITDAILAKNAHVSDAEIAMDIRDTEREIFDYERTLAAELELARSHPSPMERRLADFKAGARSHQIEERQRFVAFLRRLQEARTRALVSASPNQRDDSE